MTEEELKVQIEQTRQMLNQAVAEDYKGKNVMGLSLLLDHLIEEYLCISQKLQTV